MVCIYSFKILPKENKFQYIFIYFQFKFLPNIQEGNEGFVHHMLLYECYGNFTEEEFDEGVDCDSALNLPFVQCRFLYPTIAGLGIGEPVL